MKSLLHRLSTAVFLFIATGLLACSAESEEPDNLIITPLIESVGIVISQQQANQTNTIRFREAGSSQWQAGNPLYFDPTTDSLAGVLVYLTPATTYEVNVSVDTVSVGLQTYTATFTTRPDTPPIDPQKVYQLAEIYTGGTLDLEALNIAGKPGAWAKIVGSPDTPIVAEEGAGSAVWIGAQSYIYFENIVIEKGGVQGFHSSQAHHIWVNGCDVANWGRSPAYIEEGIAYDTEDTPINYDSAFFLQQSGVVTIENCLVHDPVLSANHWGFGHPQGPNAFFAYANHPDPAFEGQIILRNNTFTGSPQVRFNDVVESRFNGETYGGFIRDSAIYNNTFAYANDDLIELDGGQQNVLVYNNDFSHGYAGISVAPNMRGPSYLFNNTIHDMGDERGKMWASIKLGGLYSRPAGQVNIFYNYIDVYRNGITAANVDGDNAFWANAINNVMITEQANSSVGYGIYDLQKAPQSEYINNYSFNFKSAQPRNEANISEPFAQPDMLNTETARAIQNQPTPKTLAIDAHYRIANFTRMQEQDVVVGMTTTQVGVAHWLEDAQPLAMALDGNNVQRYTSQDKDHLFSSRAPHSLTLEGNTWAYAKGAFEVTPNTVLDFTVFGKHSAEIAGLGLDNNNRAAQQDVLFLYGSQNYGSAIGQYRPGNHQTRFSLNLADYFSTGSYSQFLFILDNDKPTAGIQPQLTFSNVMMYDALDFSQYALQSYDEGQDDIAFSQAYTSADGRSLTLEGNAWKRITGNFTLTENTYLVAHVKIEGNPEVAAIGFDQDNFVSSTEVVSFGGLQTYGMVHAQFGAQDGWQRIVVPVGQLFESGDYPYLTFAADNDAAPDQGKVIFKNVALVERP